MRLYRYNADEITSNCLKPVYHLVVRYTAHLITACDDHYIRMKHKLIECGRFSRNRTLLYRFEGERLKDFSPSAPYTLMAELFTDETHSVHLARVCNRVLAFARLNIVARAALRSEPLGSNCLAVTPFTSSN